MATTLIDQAVACHKRMLELAESDRQSAIQHALKGSQLFALLRQQPTPPPDWAPFLEEECCRYGAIWVHDWLRDGNAIPQHPDGGQWICQALICMDRLEQLHGSPIDWLIHVRNLLRQVQPTTAISAKVLDINHLVVIGNSQTDSLRLGLGSAFPHAQITYWPSGCLTTSELAAPELATPKLTAPENRASLLQLLANADALVIQRLPSGSPDNIDIHGLISLLPASARAIVVPQIHYGGHHPWIGYAQDPDGRLAALQAESPLGGYQDFLAMAAARRGLEVDYLLQEPLPTSLAEVIGKAHSQSLAELQQQEADCDLGLADWIADQHRQVGIVHSINQPTQATIQQLLRRLLAQLTLQAESTTRDQAAAIESAAEGSLEQGIALSIPIHPWVRQSLNLESWAASWGKKDGMAWSIQEQLASSIDFYRRHPWIGEANLENDKYRFAEQCLDLLAAPLSLHDAIWLSDSPGNALLQLAQACWNKATTGDHAALDTFINCCWHTQDHKLIARALLLVEAIHKDSPWRALYNLMLVVAGHGSKEQCGQAARALVRYSADFSVPHLRLIASYLQQDNSADSQQALVQLLPLLPEVDQMLAQPDLRPQLDKLLSQHPELDNNQRALCVNVYSRCGPSIRGPWHDWTSPAAIAPAILDNLVQRIQSALEKGEGFSLIRLGDGEGMFLCGRRPDVGGATLNGRIIEANLAANRGQLQGDEHQQLIQRFAAAIEDSDWIGIADIPQCLHGPKQMVTVAEGIAQYWQGRIDHIAPKLVPGGWHVHNCLLYCGKYALPPFNRVSGLISPSLPRGLEGQPIEHFVIPGEHWFRRDTSGEHAHYPVVFERCLDWISRTVKPGQLWLVGAGILGKIYCQAIRAQGGVAIDVGSVIDLSSGVGNTRGEYRQHPYLINQALKAFAPASGLAPASAKTANIDARTFAGSPAGSLASSPPVAKTPAPASKPIADAVVDQALPAIPAADTLFDCLWTADRPLAALEAFAERRLAKINTDVRALFEFCDAVFLSRNRRHLNLAWEALQRRPADELWTMIYSLRCCLTQDRGGAICSQLARNLLPHAAALDGNSRLIIAAVLAESYPPADSGTLSSLLGAELQAELTLHQLAHNSKRLPFAELLAKHHELLSGLGSLGNEDHCLACLTYSACAPSLRRSFQDWASSSAIAKSELEELLEIIRKAVDAGQGFSLIRLGEAEGITLKNSELGPQLMDAIRNADWVGIPDLSQTLKGPAFTWATAANLARKLSLNELFKLAPKIHPGGWLVHLALLDAGCFAAPPFNCINGLIATTTPATGLQLPAKSLVLSSSNQTNPGTLRPQEHRQVLAWIEASVEPGELFLVNSGIHGPIHCQAIKARGGIAIDVGMVLELSSHDIPRQGESRINPQLTARADWAFRPAEALPPITPMLADGRAEEARELMERFLQHQPLAAGGLLRMAEIECHGQQWGKAMDLLCRAHALEPQDSVIGAALVELQLLLRERTPYGLGPDICLTTISTRLHTLEQVVRSLQRQTMPPRRIHIYLSATPYLLDEGVDPQDERLQALREDPTVHLHWVENLGPYRKFALYLQNPANDSDDDRFITVDDDTIYPPRFIEYLAAKHLRHQCVVAHRGRRMRLRPSRGFADYTNWHDGLHEPRLGNLPTGQSGVMYRRSYFPADLQLEAALRLAPTHDDLWLRWLTALQGVPALITQPNAAAKTAALAFPMAEISSSYAKSSLWFAFNAPDAANRVTNDQAVQAIHNHFMTLGFDIEKILRIEEEEQADFY
jgi:hypothetical protein